MPTPPASPLHRDAICRRCGYPLFGLSEPRCPECGTGFDASEPASFARLSDERWPPPIHEGRLRWWGVILPTAVIGIDLIIPHVRSFAPANSLFSVVGFYAELLHLGGDTEVRQAVRLALLLSGLIIAMLTLAGRRKAMTALASAWYAGVLGGGAVGGWIVAQASLPIVLLHLPFTMHGLVLWVSGYYWLLAAAEAFREAKRMDDPRTRWLLIAVGAATPLVVGGVVTGLLGIAVPLGNLRY